MSSIMSNYSQTPFMSTQHFYTTSQDRYVGLTGINQEEHEGSILVREKPMGFILGELVASFVENTTSVSRAFFARLWGGLESIDKALSFPTAHALASPKSQWVKGPSFKHKVGNTDKHHERLVYNAPPGYAIKSHHVHEHVKYGHSGYSVQMVAGGSKFRSKVELIQKFDQLVAGATNEKKAEFKKRKNEFLSRLNEIDASHQTLVLDATAKGKGMFRGGGSLHVEVEVQIVEVDPFSTGLHDEL